MSQKKYKTEKSAVYEFDAADNYFTDFGKKITSWNTEPDGSGTSYTDSITPTEDTTLYAQWSDIPVYNFEISAIGTGTTDWTSTSIISSSSTDLVVCGGTNPKTSLSGVIQNSGSLSCACTISPFVRPRSTKLHIAINGTEVYSYQNMNMYNLTTSYTNFRVNTGDTISCWAEVLA